MQTWPSQEAYEAYLTQERSREGGIERDRRDPRQRCEHGVTTMRMCKACGIPEHFPDYLLRLWERQEGPGIAETCTCGVVTRSDREWDAHMAAAGRVRAAGGGAVEHKPRS